MAEKTNGKKPFVQAIIWGVLSLLAYVLLFTNQDLVTQYFSQGGVFAIAILLTAMLFSFVHGAFASYLLDVVGIQPLKKTDL
ncbi:hypothetical protein GFC01_01445 [Desulfofundulus thermobenzoicus]|uniref:Uncharacterized protein n=1 Tax=Desulfofundulus thermobenzoicus TaxID=29376 RepID=A0A6N7ILW6_9FIRM|nr:hypothetical protein [Desulfofundulus thermobenzoicus]MQL50955.1 hypothetical protein [Desulfofundulus thermobenzoicus]HHW42875.1 hypothetical protein [Desulfotomaculum sp.]